MLSTGTKGTKITRKLNPLRIASYFLISVFSFEWTNMQKYSSTPKAV